MIAYLLRIKATIAIKWLYFTLKESGIVIGKTDADNWIYKAGY